MKLLVIGLASDHGRWYIVGKGETEHMHRDKSLARRFTKDEADWYSNHHRLGNKWFVEEEQP